VDGQGYTYRSILKDSGIWQYASTHLTLEERVDHDIRFTPMTTIWLRFHNLKGQSSADIL